MCRISTQYSCILLRNSLNTFIPNFNNCSSSRLYIFAAIFRHNLWTGDAKNFWKSRVVFTTSDVITDTSHVGFTRPNERSIYIYRPVLGNPYSQSYLHSCQSECSLAPGGYTTYSIVREYLFFTFFKNPKKRNFYNFLKWHFKKRNPNFRIITLL